MKRFDLCENVQGILRRIGLLIQFSWLNAATVVIGENFFRGAEVSNDFKQVK